MSYSWLPSRVKKATFLLVRFVDVSRVSPGVGQGYLFHCLKLLSNDGSLQM